jgi:hypothetical protein
MPHIRPFKSLSVQGATVPAGGFVLLNPVKGVDSVKDGFLRVHNVLDIPQVLYPSRKAQSQHAGYVPKIQGDNKQASRPRET